MTGRKSMNGGGGRGERVSKTSEVKIGGIAFRPRSRKIMLQTVWGFVGTVGDTT